MAGTIIEELITLFGFKTDRAGAASVLKTYSDLHHAARDIISIASQAANALLAPITHVVKLGETAFLTGKRIGATAEEVQQLDIAARLTGVSTSALVGSIEKLANSAYKSTTRHKEQLVLLSRLGVEATTTGGKLKSPTELFFDMADALSKKPNETERLSLAIQLMGERAGQLMPLLAMGPGYLKQIREAAMEAGAVLSNDTAKAARDVSFWFQLLELRVDGVQNRIGAYFLPIISKIIGSLGQWWTANKKIIDQTIDKTLVRIGHGLGLIVDFARAMVDAVSAAVKALGGLDSVLDTLEIVIGASLLLGLGAATAAVVKFGLALLFANAMPVLMGLAFAVLGGILYLIIDDLTKANSLLKEIWEGGPASPADVPLVAALKTIRDLLNEIAGTTREIFSHQSWVAFIGDFLGERKARADAAEALARKGQLPAGRVYNQFGEIATEVAVPSIAERRAKRADEERAVLDALAEHMQRLIFPTSPAIQTVAMGQTRAIPGMLYGDNEKETNLTIVNNNAPGVDPEQVTNATITALEHFGFSGLLNAARAGHL